MVEEDRLYTYLRKNKHNNLTTLYYLGRKKMVREKDQVMLEEDHQNETAP